MATLNTAQSVVDFLKSQGKPSDFNSRKSSYDASGLAGAFGDYRGTAEQNTTLLRRLQGSQTPQVEQRQLAPTTPGGASIPEGVTYDPKTNISTVTPREVIDETTPSQTQNAYDILFDQEKRATAQEQSDLTTGLAAQTTRGAETLERGVSTLKRTAQEGISALGARGAQAQERIGEQAAGFGGAFSGTTKKSQAEVAQEVATKQQSIKAKLGDQLYNTFTDFEKNFGTKFLESLSIPEAEQFTKLPAPVRGIVMQNYQDAIQKAEEKAQKNALGTLEKLGYTVVGGQLVQTLAGRTAERQDVAAERADKRLELSEQAAVRAEKAGERADKRLEIALTRDTTSTGRAGFTKTQINKGAATAELPIDEFKELDENTKNFFINRAGDIESRKKKINAAKEDKEDPVSLEKEISESDAPQAVKDSLTKHLKTTFKDEYKKIAENKNKLPWWKRIFN